MWGDAVQIQIKETKARALSICEVEVYAETYGKDDDLRFLHVMLKKHLTTAYTYQIYIDIQEEEMTVLWTDLFTRCALLAAFYLLHGF